jgi:hypothetical protein
MHPSITPLVCSLLLLAVVPMAAHSQTPTFWTSKDGRTIDAQFVRLEGESVVVRKDGAELTLPFARLSQESVNHARSLARTVAPTTPTAGINFSGMVLDPSWLPDRLGVDQLFMESLRYYSQRVVGDQKRGEEKAPDIIYGNIRWLMPMDQAIASLGRVSKMTETKITNQAYPHNSLIIQGLQGRFQDGNSSFNLCFLIADKNRQVVSVELVAQTPRGEGWDNRVPVEAREPYHDFVNLKRNASTGNMVSFQVIPVRPGVKLIKTVLHKRPFGKWSEDVHWYLPAPLAGRFLDIADKVLK